MANINKKIAQKKIEVLTKLNDEISSLRNDGMNSAAENINKTWGETENSKSRNTQGRRGVVFLLPGVTLLILTFTFLLIFSSNAEPLARAVMTRVAAFIHAILNMRFH